MGTEEMRPIHVLYANTSFQEQNDFSDVLW